MIRRKLSLIFFFILSFFISIIFIPGINKEEEVLFFEDYKERQKSFKKISAFPFALKVFYYIRPFPSNFWKVPSKCSVFNLFYIFLSENSISYNYKVLIRPGLTSLEILNILNNNPFLKGKALFDLKEGDFFPDTYFFKFGATKTMLLKKGIEKMKKVQDELWEKRPENFHLNKEEWIILSSIVEKETHIKSEMPLIASVYINRLKKNMKLQSCPTVNYFVKKNKLTWNDLKKENDYNTYLKKGLPPGPIAMPSKEAMISVLNYKNTNFFFFLWCKDKHVFSQNFQDHKRAKLACSKR